MSKNKMRGMARKIGIVAVTVGAAAAMTVAGVTAANAATGRENLGIRDLYIVPDAPAVNFASAGTLGTINWNQGDGTAIGTVSVSTGDTSSFTVNLPIGLIFAPDACGNGDTPNVDSECSVSSNGRFMTINRTATQDFTRNFDFTETFGSRAVISTGAPIQGVPTGEYVPWTGTTTNAGTATGEVRGDGPVDTPLVLGGALAAGVLGLGAFLTTRRRKATV